MNTAYDIIITIDLVFIEASWTDESYRYLAAIKESYSQLKPEERQLFISHYTSSPIPTDNQYALLFFLYDFFFFSFF